MKFKIEQKLLSGALAIIQRSISDRTLQEVLSNVYIEADDEGIVLKGHDHKMGSEIRLQAEVSEKDKILVNASLLFDFVRKLPEGEISFVKSGNSFLTISQGNAEIKLVATDGEFFPQLTRLQVFEELEIPSLILKDMIKLTIFAASTDENQVNMNSSLLEIDEDCVNMVSCELYRMAHKRIIMKNNISPEMRRKYLIPSRCSNEIFRILQQVDDNVLVGIRLSEKMIEFKIDNIIISSQLIDKPVVDYKKLIPSEFKTSVKIDKKLLYNAIDRANLLVKMKDENSVILSINDNVLSVSINASVGNFREDIPISLEGVNLDIGFNPKFILDVLKVIESDDISFKFNTAVRPAIIKSSDDENYTYLVLPMKI